MIGLVLVTHGALAQELLAALEHVTGRQPAMACVCIGPEDDDAGKHQEVAQAVAATDGGAGVIVMTDLHGGTPSNLTRALQSEDNVRIITGVNLPMLIKLAKVRDRMPLEDAVREAVDAARKYISVVPPGAVGD